MEVDARIGCSDLALDPHNFAVTYDRPDPAELLTKIFTRSRHVR
jgi:hypothetical protein